MHIPAVSKDLQTLTFIRAPLIEETGKQVTVLAKANDRVVAARQDNLLVTSFHPELTDELYFYDYFISMILNPTFKNVSNGLTLYCAV